jgi:hypothetical protein
MLPLLLACTTSTSDTAADDDPLLGRWAGNCTVPLMGGTSTVVVDLTLDGVDGDVLTGSGEAWDDGGWALSGPVTLTATEASVAILLTGEIGSPFSIDGLWDGGDRIEGTCDIGDGVPGDILLTR